MLSIYGLDAQVVSRLDALYALIEEAAARQAEAAAVLAQVTADGDGADHVDLVFAQQRVTYAGGLLKRASARYQMSLRCLDPQSQQDYLRMRHPEALVVPTPGR